jgi:hypothetical protein
MKDGPESTYLAEHFPELVIFKDGVAIGVEDVKHHFDFPAPIDICAQN